MPTDASTLTSYLSKNIIEQHSNSVSVLTSLPDDRTQLLQQLAQTVSFLQLSPVLHYNCTTVVTPPCPVLLTFCLGLFSRGIL